MFRSIPRKLQCGVTAQMYGRLGVWMLPATCYLCPPPYLAGLIQAAKRSGSSVPSSAARVTKWPGECLYMDMIWHMEFIFWIWPVFREVSGKWGLHQQLTALHCHAMLSGRCSLLALSLLIFCINPRLLLQRNMLSKKNATKETHCYRRFHIACMLKISQKSVRLSSASWPPWPSFQPGSLSADISATTKSLRFYSWDQSKRSVHLST